MQAYKQLATFGVTAVLAVVVSISARAADGTPAAAPHGVRLELPLPDATETGASAPRQPPMAARNGMVVSVSAPASEVGLEVLKEGGTAVDAAVAVAFALAVTFPEAGNIGGGGFMMVHPGGGPSRGSSGASAPGREGDRSDSSQPTVRGGPSRGSSGASAPGREGDRSVSSQPTAGGGPSRGSSGASAPGREGDRSDSSQPTAGGGPVCIEYRETAPARAERDMFSLGETQLGHKNVGVPGTVRGLELAHQQYGRLPWKRLLDPAVRLAREGFEMDEATARSLNRVLSAETTRPFEEMRRVYGRDDGRDWRAGDRLVQEELAVTLSRIAEQGADAFYTGPIAEQIVAEMNAGGGLVSEADLKAYRANVRPAVHTVFHGYDVYGPPPPSSGGICLAQMLNVLENFPLKEQGRWSADTLHVMIEAMRRAYLDRARHLGDADFVEIPGHLTDKTYAGELAASIDLKRATSSVGLADDVTLAEESSSTTHFSVVDSSGMAVSNTYTLENSYGSRVVVRGAGFLLNNEMGDFNWKPGHTDTRGRIGTDANLIEPGKRMLSSQTPAIVARDGQPVLVTGSPGGRTIINTSLCVILNVLAFDMDVAEAVIAPRLHHQWLPDQVRLERGDPEKIRPLVEELKQRGHEVIVVPRQGDAHTIWRDPQSGLLRGMADPRISGRASGY